MFLRLLEQVGKARARGVGQFEDQQVLDRAPGAAQHEPAMGIGHPVEPRHQLLKQRAIPGHGADGEGRGQPSLLQGHGSVRAQPLDARHGQRHAAVRGLSRRDQPRGEPRELHLLGLGAAADRIAQHLDPAPVARTRGCGMGGIDTRRPLLLERQRQLDEARRPVAAERRGRRRLGLGQAEGRAVRHQRLRLGERHAACVERRRIEREPGEAEGLPGRGKERRAQQRLRVPVLLLEVLGPEEEPFRPDHPVAAHGAPQPCTTTRPPWPTSIFSATSAVGATLKL